MIQDEILRLRHNGASMMDIAKRLGVPLSRVAEVVKDGARTQAVDCGMTPAQNAYADTSVTIRMEQMADEIAALRRELAAMAHLSGELRELRDRVDVLRSLLKSDAHEPEPVWSDWMGAADLALVLGIEAKVIRAKLRGGIGTMAGRMVEARRGLSEEEKQRHAQGTRILYRYEVRP